DLLLHLGHAGLAANQDDVVNFADVDTGIFDGDAAGLDRAFDKLFDKRFQFGTSKLEVKVFGTRSVRRDVRKVDFGLLSGGQLDLGLLGRFLEALQGQYVLGQIDAAILLELANNVVDEALVEVFATQEGVAVGGQHFELLLAVDIGNFDDRDIEGTAAQVVHGNLAVALLGLVHAEGQCGSSRFVDDALDIQAGNASGVFCSLPLAVVKVRRYGNDRFGDLFAEIIFGGFLHFAQYVSRHLRRRELLAQRFNPGITVIGLDDFVRHQIDVFLYRLLVKLAANKTLDGIQSIGWVRDRLTLCRSAHQNLAVLQIGHDGRRRARALGVLDDLDLVAVHDGHTTVGRAKVNTNYFAHDL